MGLISFHVALQAEPSARPSGMRGPITDPSTAWKGLRKSAQLQLWSTYIALLHRSGPAGLRYTQSAFSPLKAHARPVEPTLDGSRCGY